MTEEEKEIQAEEMPSPEEEFKTHLKEAQDKYLRTLAEMENMRKRMQKEKQEAMRFAIENVAADFLKPLDNLENALKFTSHMSEDTRNWAKGFEMILMQFKDVLSEHGITAFESEGHFFDPLFHEAVEMTETDEVEAGKIIKEFNRGYKCAGRVIRPAKVAVAKSQSPQEIKEEK